MEIMILDFFLQNNLVIFSDLGFYFFPNTGQLGPLK